MTLKTLFDADFRYRNADTTDVRLTFARIRREQRKAQKRNEHDVAEVLPIDAQAITAVPLDSRSLGSHPVPPCQMRDAREGKTKDG